MLRTTLLLFVLVIAFIASAQDVQTRYYRDRYEKEDVPKEKARYAETVERFEDGSVATTITNLKKNEIEFREVWKGDEPVGKWIGLTGRGPQEMDFDFTVIYTETGCPSDGTTSSIKELLSDNEAFNYVAPKVDDEDSYLGFIRKNLRYPAKARRAGIQGTVHLILTITEEGKVEDVKVTNGADRHLDKEAARVVRALKFLSPPKLDGEPKRICVKMPIKFKLA